MYCPNCGEKMEETDNFCIKCGKARFNPTGIQNNIPNPQQPLQSNNISEEDKRKANLLCTISLLLTYGSSIFPSLLLRGDSEYNTIFSSLAGLAPLVGLVLMIIARVKYPNSKFARVLMWIYLINFIIILIGMIIIFITCVSMIQSCS